MREKRSSTYYDALTSIRQLGDQSIAVKVRLTNQDRPFVEAKAQGWTYHRQKRAPGKLVEEGEGQRPRSRLWSTDKSAASTNDGSHLYVANRRI